jgi:hypothetical protein
MSETADLAKARQEDPEGSGKNDMTPTASNSVSVRSVEHAVGSTLFDSIAVWVSEGGAGGEVIR